MFEDESLSEFYTKSCDICNKSFALGEKILESILTRKIIRSLPDRFQPKTTAIEEGTNLDTMKVEELMGSLRAFEMNMQHRKKKKKKKEKRPLHSNQSKTKLRIFTPMMKMMVMSLSYLRKTSNFIFIF